MNTRFTHSPGETAQMDTAHLRDQFLVTGLMVDDAVNMVYSHYDRMIIGGAKPVLNPVSLPVPGELKAESFLERREIGIINVGGKGSVNVDGETYELNKLDCLYIGKGAGQVSFSSVGSGPAVFYFLSAPAHHTYPTSLLTRENASPVKLGSPETSNERTIYKYIHKDGIKSCQLVMGLTLLEKGSVWNSVPPHTHTRRMEVYFYFDLGADQRVFHFMGEPRQTRHLLVSNLEAVISPPWSVHFGCGTANYGFIWGMAGENQEFTDMDGVKITELE
jgi:4-deoxy-L-threo-5-hexosulose-uronate ketol-isomerase